MNGLHGRIMRQNQAVHLNQWLNVPGLLPHVIVIRQNSCGLGSPKGVASQIQTVMLPLHASHVFISTNSKPGVTSQLVSPSQKWLFLSHEFNVLFFLLTCVNCLLVTQAVLKESIHLHLIYLLFKNNTIINIISLIILLFFPCPK